MTDTDIHSCGYYCDRPLCIKAQRDELRNKLFSEQAVKTYEPVIDKSMAKRIATQLGWEPKREWVGLTEQEQSDIAWEKDKSRIWIVTATEAKLKEKNT
jgi:hypothetical protein